jgi:sec-independent protein translocase protein TatC
MVANLRIDDYLSFVMRVILAFGVVFELPVLSFILTKIGILTPKFLSSKRRYGIVIVFIIAAILTPPDPLTQLMMATPLLVLYEISILVSKIVVGKESKKN